MVSLGAAPLALPTFATAGFLDFWGRALRVTLPAGFGRVVHLFVVYGYQGAEEDAEKLQLTDKLLQAVLVEARVVCTGQLVLIAGDLNADPAVVLGLVKAISPGRFVDLALAYSVVERKRPAATCKFKLDVCCGSRRDFILGCSNAVAASTACRVTDRWFPPHFSLFSTFGIDGCAAEISCPIVSQPLWPACWIDSPDRSASFVSRAVQDAWGVYGDELGVVPLEVALPSALSRSSVDDFWSSWSKNAEAGLFFFGAYCRVGGPTAAGSPALLGRGLLRIRSRCLGGRAVDGRGSSRLYRASQGDEVDVHCSQYFVNSSLAPVVLFRRRLKSVADELKGIRNKGLLSPSGMLY